MSHCDVTVSHRCTIHGGVQVILDTDGVLHAMSVDRRCQYHVDIGETSLVSLVSHDLLPAVPGVELLIATSDGTLLCLSAGNVSQSTANQISSSLLRELARVTAWPAELRSHNDALFTDSVSNTEYQLSTII